MDLFFDATNATAVSDLRTELGRYFRRHGTRESDYEAGDDKIVLGNRACPFGDAVERAPGLCRTTSSVFGGIAARNTGRAAVVLEERIAVGDPECRIVIWLGADKTGRWEAAHDYDPDPTAGSEDRGQ